MGKLRKRGRKGGKFGRRQGEGEKAGIKGRVGHK
jgi:hypothetical protein